jgi:hypothetical protein
MAVTISGSGQVPVQVIQAVKTDTFATTPGAVWADVAGLSVSITPTSVNSKILVIVDMKASGTAGTSIVRSRLMRNSTAVYVGNAASNRPRVLGQFYNGDGGDNGFYMAQIGGTYLDSPATTSTVTYKIQIGGDADGSTLYVNRTNNDRDGAYYDSRGVSSITLMEISG